MTTARAEGWRTLRLAKLDPDDCAYQRERPFGYVWVTRHQDTPFTWKVSMRNDDQHVTLYDPEPSAIVKFAQALGILDEDGA